MAEAISRDDVQELVTQVLVDEIGVDADQITLDATLESLDIDSIDLVEVAQVVEEKWGFRIRAEDAKGVETLGEAVDMIVKVGQSGVQDDGHKEPVAAETGAEPGASGNRDE
jgi:acyl carrier protein